jgi:hypothetical protein
MGWLSIGSEPLSTHMWRTFRRAYGVSPFLLTIAVVRRIRSDCQTSIANPSRLEAFGSRPVFDNHARNGHAVSFLEG